MNSKLFTMQLTDSFLPIVGGKQLVVHNLSVTLRRNVYNNIVVVTNFSGNLNYKLSYSVYSNPLRIRQFSIFYYYLYVTYRILASKINLIHAHRTYPAGYYAVKIGKFLNIPVILTPHGDDILTVKEINYGINLNSRMRKKSIYALNNANAVIAINKGMRSKIIDFGVKSENVYGIPIGIDIENFNNNKKIKTGKNIVAIGRNHPIKDYNTLLEAIAIALKKDDEINCTIIGKDSEKLINKVKSLGIQKNVTLLKEISGSINNGIPKRLLSILFNNNIYVSSSLSESFGLTILEAMAMGLSIIATDTIGSKELVENGKNGFIVPKSNPTIMANQILKLINDSDLQKKFGKKSLLKARKLKYSWNNIALEHTNLYKKLIFDFKRKKK